MTSIPIEASQEQLEVLNSEQPVRVPPAKEEERFLSVVVIAFFVFVLMLWMMKVVFHSY
jgi:hypothetical protein